MSYKANDGTAKQVSLADGLNFKDGTLTTATIDDAGVVKYDVKTAAITAGTDGTVTGPATDGVATAKNVADAINAVSYTHLRVQSVLPITKLKIQCLILVLHLVLAIT